MGTAIKKGVVFDIKKFAVDDGPGIRTTIFLKGCPMRCWWCHNPEGQLSTPELMYRKNRCISCEDCISSCPRRALSISGRRKLSIDRKNCNVCGKCALKCPTGALEIVGKEIGANEVVKEIVKDSAFYDESRGGITISGGEPLLQIDFLNALLDECKNRNVHTVVDTSGFASRVTIEKIKDKVDLFLYDIKIMDEKRHKKYTGVSNKQILENFKTLANNGSDLLVRVPIVPGITDSRDNVARIAEFIVSCSVEHTCLLPYHRAGIEKYRGLGRSYKLKKIGTTSEQRLNSIKEQLEDLGLSVRTGG